LAVEVIEDSTLLAQLAELQLAEAQLAEAQLAEAQLAEAQFAELHDALWVSTWLAQLASLKYR
jgi:hypothetical protein